jgi:hypothetical protein
MSSMKLLFFIILGFWDGPLDWARLQLPLLEQSDVAKAQFVLGPRYIHMPEQLFLLVRKGSKIGAVKFTKIEQDAFGNGKSTYESYFQGDESRSFLAANVVKRSGEIYIKPMKGFHPFAWQPGQNKLWIGKWWFGCLSPSLINMSLHFSEKGNGFEFAPTSVREIGQVHAADKRIRWFRYDANARITVPVSDLPRQNR